MLVGTMWSLFGVRGPATEWLMFLGTLFLGLVALLGIPEVRSWFFKPRIRPVEMGLIRIEHEREDKPTIIYWRLIIKNVWRFFGRSAEDVGVLLTYDTCSPRNFIPIPLRWTYFNSFKRDLSRGEPAYLDVLEEKPDGDGTKYEFVWARDVAGWGSAMGVIKDLNSGYGDLRLEFFERNGGRIGDVKISNLMDERKFKVISYE